MTPALAALAERLGQAAGTAGLRAGLAGGAPAGTASGAGLTTRNERPAIQEQGALVDLTEILALPLDGFAREGQCLEVQVPWLDVTLWFVPEERDAQALGREGVGRGRIWTAEELMAVMALPDHALEIVRRVALAKHEVEGDIVEVRPHDQHAQAAGIAAGWGGARAILGRRSTVDEGRGTGARSSAR